MSVAPEKGWPSNIHITFRCPQCHAQEGYKVGVAGTLIPRTRPNGSDPR